MGPPLDQTLGTDRSLHAIVAGTRRALLSTVQRKTSLGPLITIPLLPLVTGCSAIEAIFKAGVWVGVIAVVGVIALLFGVVKYLSSKGKR